LELADAGDHRQQKTKDRENKARYASDGIEDGIVLCGPFSFEYKLCQIQGRRCLRHDRVASYFGTTVPDAA
jgi:hypothetical protein